MFLFFLFSFSLLDFHRQKIMCGAAVANKQLKLTTLLAGGRASGTARVAAYFGMDRYWLGIGMAENRVGSTP